MRLILVTNPSKNAWDVSQCKKSHKSESTRRHFVKRRSDAEEEEIVRSLET
jgi:hypothetical protein